MPRSRPTISGREAADAARGRAAFAPAPSIEDGPPSTIDGPPDTEDRTPSTDDRRPATEDGAPSTVDGAPDGENLTATADRVPDTDDGAPSTVDGRRPRRTPARATSTDRRPPSALDRGRSTGGRRGKDPAEYWERRNTRQTVWMALDVLEAVHAEMDRSGRSKAQVVDDALREHLGLTAESE